MDIGLEHRILNGLVLEWEESWLDLPIEYRARVYKPIFLIKPLKSRLGYWSRVKREICISENLVLKHPWDAVVDVLRHEMAHQVTDEAMNAADEPPHGEKFKQVCQWLNANPKASGAYQTLHEKLKEGINNSENSNVRRVKKLLALAESQNQHEAEAAMAKAHQLIKKYHIESIKNDLPKDFISIYLGKPALRHTRDKSFLSHLIMDYYFVKGLWVQSFVLEKNKMGRVLEISGSYQNVQTASYAYDFITHFINQKWAVYNKNKRLNAHRRVDFSVGVIRGFRSKMEGDAQKEKISSSKEITKIEDPQLNIYFKNRFPSVVSMGRSNARQDATVIDDGIEVGKQMVISQGIEEKGYTANKGIAYSSN